MNTFLDIIKIIDPEAYPLAKCNCNPEKMLPAMTLDHAFWWHVTREGHSYWEFVAELMDDTFGGGCNKISPYAVKSPVSHLKNIYLLYQKGGTEYHDTFYKKFM